MTTKQPEANNHGATDYKHKAAAELRRLRKANVKLLAFCNKLNSRPADYLCAEDWVALETVLKAAGNV